MHRSRISAFILSFLFFAPFARAGPYGLKMGMPLEALDGTPAKIGPDK